MTQEQPFIIPEDVPSEEHLKTVCKLGHGPATCAYLLYGNDDFSLPTHIEPNRSGIAGWCCAKKTIHEETLRQRVMRGTIGARGDNCSGPREFTELQQGSIT